MPKKDDDRCDRCRAMVATHLVQIWSSYDEDWTHWDMCHSCRVEAQAETPRQQIRVSLLPSRVLPQNGS